MTGCLLPHMNRRDFIALAATLVGQAFAFPAIADQQRFAERSLIVNVNTATVAELMTVPEIGQDLAIAIVRNRPYKRLESLLRVSGIAECTLGAMIPYVKIDGKTEPYVPEQQSKSH